MRTRRPLGRTHQLDTLGECGPNSSKNLENLTLQLNLNARFTTSNGRSDPVASKWELFDTTSAILNLMVAQFGSSVTRNAQWSTNTAPFKAAFDRNWTQEIVRSSCSKSCSDKIVEHPINGSNMCQTNGYPWRTWRRSTFRWPENFCSEREKDIGRAAQNNQRRLNSWCKKCPF